MSESVEVAKNILSEVTTFMKYAKYDKGKQRRETWMELVDRNKQMHLKKYPHIASEIEDAYQFVYRKEVLPSMRSLQFAGLPIEMNNARIFNCAYTAIDHPDAFSETMFLLLSGVGVGYSVQRHHVEKLPAIIKPTKTRRYLVNDSIEGWAESIKVLISAYMRGKALPNFDFRDIRPKGARLVTAGGKAPGPEPLKDCLHNLQKVLDRKQNGEKLSALEVHDMLCFIADAVLAGGIRRSAMISLFNMDDEEMLTCKFGSWWELNPQRARSNNSAVIVRHKADEATFLELWGKIEASGSGEPGFFFTNDKEWGLNPCAEISLRSGQCCNLATFNASSVKSQEELEDRVRAASLIATLQAGYTDFHYLRDSWKRVTEKEALIGISATGVASEFFLSLDMVAAATAVNEENERVAKLIGINKAARTTCIKPEGSTSLVLGTSSGVHAWHNDYYIRRIRVDKSDAIYSYLSTFHPELIKDEFFRPTTTAVIEAPQKAPDGAILRHESALDMLARVKNISDTWIKTGHRKGENMNNVSATVSIKPDEWESVGQWMWENRYSYTALSVLPADGGTYVQAPFEDITKEKYEELLSHLSSIDLQYVLENDDETNLSGELACSSGACEIT